MERFHRIDLQRSGHYDLVPLAGGDREHAPAVDGASARSEADVAHPGALRSDRCGALGDYLRSPVSCVKCVARILDRGGGNHWRSSVLDGPQFRPLTEWNTSIQFSTVL